MTHICATCKREHPEWIKARLCCQGNRKERRQRERKFKQVLRKRVRVRLRRGTA